MLKSLIFALLAGLFFSPDSSHACTGAYCSTEGGWEVGYNMDWYWHGGMIVTRPKGLENVSFASAHHKWVSRYRSVAFSNFSPTWPFAGVNEYGLQVFCLGTPTKIIDSASERAHLPAVNELEIISLLLDTARNTAEAEEVLRNTRIEYFSFPLHYMICDSAGCLIVDFKDQLRIHRTQPREQAISNEWYDEMVQSKKANTDIGWGDTRGRILLEMLEKSPTDVDRALKQVHQGKFTSWYVRVFQKTGQDIQLVFKTTPYSYGEGWPEITHEINLTQIFQAHDFDKQSKWISVGNNSWAKPSPTEPWLDVPEHKYNQLNWQILTSEQERNVFAYNLQQASYQSQVYGRNKDGTDYKTKFSNLVKALTSTAIIPVPHSVQCSDLYH